MYDSSSDDDEICFGPLTLEECKKYLRTPLNLPSKITIRKPQHALVEDRQKENCLGLANLSIDNVSKHNSSLKLSKDAKNKTNDTNNVETIEISSDEESCVEIFDQNEEDIIKKDCLTNAEKTLNDNQAKNDTSSFRSSMCNYTADSLDVHVSSKHTDFSKDSLRISTQSTDIEESLKVVYFKQLNYEQKKLETSATENKTDSSDSRQTVDSVFSDIQKKNEKLNLKEKFEISATSTENKRNESKIDDSLVENVSIVDDVLKTNDSETVEILLRQSNFASDNKNNDESKSTQLILENDEVNKRAEENAEYENSVLITAGKLIEEFHENICLDVYNFASGLKILPEIKLTENTSANVSSHLVFENSGNVSKNLCENIFLEKIPEKNSANIELKNISANDSSHLFLENVFENSGSVSKNMCENIFVEKIPEKNTANNELKYISANDSSRLFLENVFENSGSVSKNMCENIFVEKIPEKNTANNELKNISANDSSHLFLENVFENSRSVSKNMCENIFVEKIPEKNTANNELKNISANDSSYLFLENVFENSGNASNTKKYFDNSYKHNLENSLSEAGNNSLNPLLENVASMDSLNILSPSTLDNTTFSQPHEAFDLKTKLEQIRKETELSDITEMSSTNKSETSSLIHLLSDLENSEKSSSSKFSERKDEKSSSWQTVSTSEANANEMISDEEKNSVNSDRKSFESSSSYSQKTTSEENASATENGSQDYRLSYDCSKDRSFDSISASNATYDACSNFNHENDNNISANESIRFDNVFENFEKASENIFMEKIPERSTTNIEFKNICSKHPSRLFLNVFENSENASRSMSEDIFMEKIPERSATNTEFKNISARESSGLFLENVFENSGKASKNMSEDIFMEKIPERSATNTEFKNISSIESSGLFLENVFVNSGKASKSMSENIFIEKIPEKNTTNIETLKLVSHGELENTENYGITSRSDCMSSSSNNNKTMEYCSTDKNDDSKISNDLSLPKLVETVPKTTFENIDKSTNSVSDIYSKDVESCSKTSESKCVENRLDVLNKLKNTSSSSWETVSNTNSTINKEKSDSKSSLENNRQSENLNISIDSTKSSWKMISNENFNSKKLGLETCNENLNDSECFKTGKEHCVDLEKFEQGNESSNSFGENSSSENVPSSNESNLFHKENYDDSFKFSNSFESRRTSDFNTSGEFNDTMEEIERIIKMHDMLNKNKSGVNPALSESSKYQNTIVKTPLQNEQKQNILSLNKTSCNQKQNSFTINKTPLQGMTNKSPLYNTITKNKTPLHGMTNKSPLSNTITKNKTPLHGMTNKSPLCNTITKNKTPLYGMINKSPLCNTITKNKTPLYGMTNKSPLSNTITKNKTPLHGMTNKSPLCNTITKNKTSVQGKINSKTPMSIEKQTAVARTPSMEDIIQKTPNVKQTYNRFKNDIPRTGATKMASHNKPIEPKTDIKSPNPQNIKKTDQLLKQAPSDIKKVTGTLKKSEIPTKSHESNFKSLLKKPQVYGSHSEVFKTPTPRLKKPKSPSQYDNIVSPIGLYINKSSAPVLMSNVKSKNINRNDLLTVEHTSVQRTGVVGGCLPHRVYSKASKVDETTEQDQILPQNIRELFPSSQQVVIKHVQRYRSGTNTEQLDYSLNDSVMQLANSSAIANSPGLVDVSVHVARSGIQSAQVTPKKK